MTKVSDYIASFLYAQGVRNVFEVLGGMITHLVDSIHQQGKIRLISTHHEQAAAFAADATARMTGLPGVAMATSGPGATNLLTGIGNCHFDSTPAVFITGQVNRKEQKGSRQIRQLGFQETDIVSMARPIVKAAWQVQTPEDVPKVLEQAFVSTLSGRPGPVLIDLPMDVQRAEIVTEETPRVSVSPSQTLETGAIAEMLDRLVAAERPLLLVGGGIRTARAAHLLSALIAQVKVPVVNSLMGVDVLPADDPLRVGMIGTYGNRWANLAIARSDFLLVLGSRLDIRQTGADVRAFKAEREIYHLDCDAGEINNRVTGCRSVLGDLHTLIGETVSISSNRNFPEHLAWQEEIAALRSTWPDTKELRGLPGINPNEFIHQLTRASQNAAAFVVDVGQHQMWAAQSAELRLGQRFLTSGGMGAMGFALPAALGVAFAVAPRPVVAISGDGGFQLNLQELQTVAHHRLPIKIVILNNHCYGMIRQFQESYFEDRYPSSWWGYSAPDFCRVAAAYDLLAHSVASPDEVEAAVRWLWQDPTTPALLNVEIHPLANALPKIAYGQPMTTMEQFATPRQ